VGAKKVILGGRDPKLQSEFVAKLKEEQGDVYDTDQQVDGSANVDLADLQSVSDFATYVDETYETIDCLICNAGIMNTPAGVTKDGFEQQLGVNVIGHFLLAKMLVAKTKRQVWVASHAHTLKGGPRIDVNAIQSFSLDEKDGKGYDGFRSYQQSKLGNILLAKAFQKRYDGQLVAVSLHPGVIYTPLYSSTGIVSAIKLAVTMIPDIVMGNLTQVIPKTASGGASTTITCATMPLHKLEPGGYYSNCAIATPNVAARNEEDAEAFFEFCDKVTKKFQ